MKQVWSYLNYYKKESVLAPLFKLLEVAGELAVPLIVAALVDHGIAKGD